MREVKSISGRGTVTSTKVQQEFMKRRYGPREHKLNLSLRKIEKKEVKRMIEISK